MTSSAAAGLLSRQLKQMQTDKDIPGISCGLVDNNVFEWEVILMISDDCRYYGGAQAFSLFFDFGIIPWGLSASVMTTTHCCRRWILPRPSHFSS